MAALRSAEERSLAYHRAVAERLLREPEAVERARARVEGWLRTGGVHVEYARAWAGLLAGPVERIRSILVDRGERAAALRHVSPFAGFLSPRDRWRILRETRREPSP